MEVPQNIVKCNAEGEPCDTYTARRTVIVTHCKDPDRCVCGHERSCHLSEQADA